MNDDAYWGKCSWGYNEINKARIECDWDDGNEPLKGNGIIEARVREDGTLRIDIVSTVSNTGTEVKENIISIPPTAFSSIKRHPDPSRFDFLLQR
jgi:hypothetical protein